MDEHVNEFFSRYSDETNKGNFHRIIVLHDSPDCTWRNVSPIAPALTRGWFELSQLPSRDRLDFTYEFWLSKFSYHPNMGHALETFFNALDDIGIYITQKAFDDPYQVQMVYCLSENRGFYRGMPPASEENILDLQKLFTGIILPPDYLAFLQIHNGFCKATDCTGITSTFQMKKLYDDFQSYLEEKGGVSTKGGRPVNPKSLMPFYESFGMPFYQCFWSEWHPEQEMGNVYYSSADNTISYPIATKNGSFEQMAFPNFSDWLAFYLEQIEM